MLNKILASIAIAGVLLSGCGSSGNSENSAGGKETKVASILQDYKGEYKSINSAIKDPSLKSMYEKIAMENPSYSQTGVQAKVLSFLGSGIDTMVIDDDTITFSVKGKEEVVKYEKVKSDDKMLVLKSVEDPKSIRGLKYLGLTKIHDDDGFKHFHLKTGASEARLMASSSPIFTPKDVSVNKVAEHLMENESKIAKRFSEPSLKDWAGDWTSIGSYIDNPAPQILEAYANISKETGEADVNKIKQALRMVLLGNIDFKTCKVVADNKENKIIYTLNDGSTKEVSYKLDGTTSAGSHGYWINFKATTDADKFNNLLVSAVHGEPAHFHVKQGSISFEDLAKTHSVPTALKSDSGIDAFAEEIEEFGKFAVKMMSGKK